MYYPSIVSAVFERELAFDSLCGVPMGFRERLLAFDSLWTGLVIVTSNVYIVCLCELCYYRFNFQTTPLKLHLHVAIFVS